MRFLVAAMPFNNIFPLSNCGKNMIFLLGRCMITCPIRHNNPAVLVMFLLTLFGKKKVCSLWNWKKQVKSEENEGMSHVQEKGKKNKNGRGNRGLATIQNCGVEGEWEKKKLLKKCFWLKYYSPHYMIYLAFFQDKFHFLLKESGSTPQSGSAGEEVQGWQWHNVFLPNYFSVITCSTLSSSAQHLPKTNPAASRKDGGNHFSPDLKKINK